MLNHTPKDRPTAVESRLKYKQFVKDLASNADKGSQIEELLDQLMDFGSKPTIRRNRIARRSRLNRHRNVYSIETNVF